MSEALAAEWPLACPDWHDRLKAGMLPIRDVPIDRARGDRAVAIFSRLRLADVPGNPMLGDVCGPWFLELVRVVFGAFDPGSRERAIREFFVLVPKKNSKTTYGALLMLTALLLNERPAASMIMTAPVIDVADLAFDAAAGAIELDETLQKLCKVQSHLKTITHRQSKAELSIMTFDPATLTGQKPVAVLIDELHVVAKMRKAPSAIRQLRGGMLPYPEAFMLFITTQSEEAPTGVFLSELNKARAIRDGKQPGEMLPVLYEFPESVQKDPEQWKNPEIWPLVTPNAGRSITLPRLVREMRTAEATSEGELRAWASQHLNVQVGLVLHANAWPGAMYWEQCALLNGLTLERLIERSEVITVGIDGGGLDDLLGLCVMGRCKESRAWLTWAHGWAHPSVMERRKSEAERLLGFRDDGDLTLVEQIGDDLYQVAEIVRQVFESGLMDLIGVDPVGLGGIIDVLVDDQAGAGVPEDQIVGISQGYKLSGAIKTMERRLAGRAVQHAGAPLMDWCVGNARVVQVGNAINITKAASGTAKIDPLMATFNAADLMSRNPVAKGNIWDFINDPVIG